MSLLTPAPAIYRRQKTRGLGQRFLVFRFGIGIGHNARADVEIIFFRA